MSIPRLTLLSSICLLALLLTLSPPAWAQLPATGTTFEKGCDHVSGVPFEGDRTQGDTVEDPFVIAGLPFETSGNTCGFAHDYDEICPYGESNSPDVVYVHHEYGGLYVEVNLCASLYDTKVFVYDFAAGFGIGNPIACNDDAACGITGYQSRVELYFAPGHTYHIVVDGYGSDCGDYDLQIHEIIYEILECPLGALTEGEVDCYDDYADAFNGGCNSTPPIFSVLEGSVGGAPFSVCGTAGNFTFGGEPYRDTDWYEVTVEQDSEITFECSANFPVTIFFLDGNQGCEGLQILDFDQAGYFPDYAQLTRTFAPGTYWFWVGPSVFEQVPCGSLYVMTVTGYVGPIPSPVETTTWGALKGRFR